jgi:hypothetical protein
VNTISRDPNQVPPAVRVPNLSTPGESAPGLTTVDGPTRAAPDGSGWGGTDRLRDLAGDAPATSDLPATDPVANDVTEAEAEIRLLLLLLALFPMNVRRGARGIGASADGEEPDSLLSRGGGQSDRRKGRGSLVQDHAMGATAIAPEPDRSSPPESDSRMLPRSGSHRPPSPRTDRAALPGPLPGMLPCVPVSRDGMCKVSRVRRRPGPDEAPAVTWPETGWAPGGTRRKPTRRAGVEPARDNGQVQGPSARAPQDLDRAVMPETDRPSSGSLERRASARELVGVPASLSGRRQADARAAVLARLARQAGQAWRRVQPGVMAIAVLVVVFATIWPSVSATLR